VFLLTTGELPFSRSQKHALLAFVHDGGGLVGFHSATDTFKHDPRSHVHVLVRLDTHGGPDRPLVWCRRSARGRVFYDALGYFSQTWSDPRQLELVSGGIAWAAGLAAAPSC
jgi:type 1 glutamine amidotransferase